MTEKKHTREQLNKINVDKLISRRLVTSSDKKQYSKIYDNWIKIATNDDLKAKFIDFLYKHQSNNKHFEITYEYVPIPPGMFDIKSDVISTNISSVSYVTNNRSNGFISQTLSINNIIDFCRKPNGIHFKKKSVAIKYNSNKFMFKATLIPNHNGHVEYYIQYIGPKYKQKVKPIKSIVVCVYLCEINSQSKYTQAKIFSSKNDNDKVGWIDEYIPLSTEECELYNALKFEHKIEILRVDYENNYDNKMNGNVKFQTIAEHTWKKCSFDNGLRFSDNINNDMFCFSILCVNDENIYIGLHLLKLPLMINNIKVKFSVKICEFIRFFVADLSYCSSICRFKLCPNTIERIKSYNQNIDLILQIEILDNGDSVNNISSQIPTFIFQTSPIICAAVQIN
eukprot:542845_1